jgi:hypothetical protein
MTLTTASFDTGSEFRVNWTTEIKNPKFNLERARNQGPHYKVSQDIVTSHKSEIFSTYEAAEAFKATVERGHISNRKPGQKAFIARKGR